MKRAGLVLCILLTRLCWSEAQEPEQGEVRGINPADNITKFEILPKFTMIDDAMRISTSTLTLKYDRAFNGKYGINLELPLAYFDSLFSDAFGQGDTNIRARIQFPLGKMTGIAGLEMVVPTATDATLGTGKLQINPTLVGVYPFSRQTFGALVVKHLFSLAGDDDRDDIVQGQYRLLFAHSTSSGWWFLVDPQLWVNYQKQTVDQDRTINWRKVVDAFKPESDSRAGSVAKRLDEWTRVKTRHHYDTAMSFEIEGEIGKMIAPNVGVWLRGGGRLTGDWERQDWSIGTGVRFMFF